MITKQVLFFARNLNQTIPSSKELWKKDLNPFPDKPWFLRVCSMSLENKVGKGEIAQN